MDEEKKVDQNETLERMSSQIKGIADKFEGLPEIVREEVDQRLKETVGDVVGFKEEQAEIRAAHDAQFKALTEAVQDLRAPGAVAVEERDEFYDYGPDGLGHFINDVIQVGQRGGQLPSRLAKMQRGEMERRVESGELESRRLDTLSGADGGWFAPEQWSNQFLSIPDDQQYLRSMCRNLPPGSPPNAEIKIRSLDQTGSLGVYGGVTVYSAVEAAAVSALTTPKIKVVSLKPEKVGAYYQLTEELRANADAMAGLVGPLLQGGIAAYNDDKIQTGTGAGEMLGFAGCDAEISVTRGTANEVNYIDLVNMLANVITRGNYVWLCQRVDMLPQLMTMTDGAGQLIWTSNARDGAPAPRLAGIPIFFNEISPALGSAGDLRLVDLSYYLVKPGMGVSITSDNTMYASNFLAGIETIRVIYYIDGKPWLTDALTLRDGTNTVSPFISLAA